MPVPGPAQGVSAASDGYLAVLNFAEGAGAAAPFGELGEVDITVTNGLNDATSHQSAGWKTQKPGLKSWTATAKGVHLGTDVTQQQLRAALAGDAMLTLTHYPEGMGSGKTMQTGNCFIKDWKFSADSKDLAKADFSIEGTGPLTETLQA